MDTKNFETFSYFIIALKNCNYKGILIRNFEYSPLDEFPIRIRIDDRNGSGRYTMKEGVFFNIVREAQALPFEDCPLYLWDGKVKNWFNCKDPIEKAVKILISTYRLKGGDLK